MSHTRKSQKKKPPAKPASAERRALLAKIHIARKQLSLDEESYRARIQEVTGQTSAGQCSDGALVAILDKFRKLGFRDESKPSSNPQARAIYAIWADLKPYLRNPSTAALNAFCLRMTQVENPEWLKGPKANIVIEALKDWLARAKAEAAAKGGGDANP